MPVGSLTMCTWSEAAMGREEYPINCITQAVARAFCQFDGGNIPTEAAWEHAATVAGRDHKTHYAWGDGNGLAPACGNVVYDREPAANGPSACPGYGPSPVTVAEVDGGDVTPGPGAGLVDLGGNVAEWMLDTFASYGANCWLAASQTAAECAATPTVRNIPGIYLDAITIRGGYWSSFALNLIALNRDQVTATEQTPAVGFRCARAGGP